MRRERLRKFIAQAPAELLARLQRDLARRLARNPLVWIDGPHGIVPLRWTPKQVEAWREQRGKAVFGFHGGNRMGKTVWAAARTAETLLGLKHEDWVALPSDPRRWQLGPAREVWAITVSYEKSRDVQQRALWERIPRRLWRNRWHAATGFPQNVGELVGGGKVVFKTCEQHLRTFEGSRIDLAWIDETIPLVYFLAILPRCVDRAAPILWTSIFDDPLLDDVFLERSLDPSMTDVIEVDDIGFVGGEMRDNPHLSERQIKLVERLMPSDQRQMRIYGRPSKREGLVYADFSEMLHVRACEPPLSEEHWHNRIEVMDPGWDNPCAVAFAVVEPGKVYGFYDEIYRRHRTVGEIACEMFLTRWIWRGLMSPEEIEQFQRLTEGQEENLELTTAQQISRDRELKALVDRWRAVKGDCRPRLVLVDESAKQKDQAKPVSCLRQLRDFGIVGRPASNRDKKGQQNAVRQMLRPTGGLVRLWVSPWCKWGLWEFKHHRKRKPPQDVGEFTRDKELIVDAHNHFLSCVEYLVEADPQHRPLGLRKAPHGSLAERHGQIIAARAPRRRGR